MESEPAEVQGDRPPGARELLPLLPIVLVVSWIVRSFALYPWVTTRTAVVLSVLSAGLIGLPVLFWALDHGHRRLVALLLLGSAVGVLPLLVLVSSGLVGVTLRAGLDNALRLFERGAPIPGLGTMPWWTFARAEGFAAATGAISAGAYWLLVLAPDKFRRRAPRP